MGFGTWNGSRTAREWSIVSAWNQFYSSLEGNFAKTYSYATYRTGPRLRRAAASSYTGRVRLLPNRCKAQEKSRPPIGTLNAVFGLQLALQPAGGVLGTIEGTLSADR